MKDFQLSELEKIFIGLNWEYDKAKKDGHETLGIYIDSAMSSLSNAINESKKDFEYKNISNNPSWKNHINTLIQNYEKAKDTPDFKVPDRNVAEFILGTGLAAWAVYKDPNSEEAKEILKSMEEEIDKRNLDWDKETWFKSLEAIWGKKT